MTKPKALKLISGILVVMIIAILATNGLRSLPQNLTLRFHPYVGDKPLVLHDQSYKNPGGNGYFSVRDLQLFISNIVVSYSSTSIKESESYHLVRFDGSTSFDEIIIPEIKLQNIKQLSFGIGIDPKANGTILFSGDLDPNSRMAWNWQVGYKFLLLEGTLTLQDQQLPLVYHIGFDESYTELAFDITADITNDMATDIAADLTNKNLSNDGVINFKIDLLRLFQKNNSHTPKLLGQPSNESIEYIDMAEMSHVKFAPDDVRIIAKGFEDFISIL
jgi:hypothetical protein